MYNCIPIFSIQTFFIHTMQTEKDYFWKKNHDCSKMFVTLIWSIYCILLLKIRGLVDDKLPRRSVLGMKCVTIYYFLRKWKSKYSSVKIWTFPIPVLNRALKWKKAYTTTFHPFKNMQKVNVDCWWLHWFELDQSVRNYFNFSAGH